jgi:hypothetical protein
MASSAQKNHDIREFARRFVRVLEINDGDVILLKSENVADNLDMFNGLRSALASVGKKKCLLVAVQELDDVRTLSPTSMAEYGWYRKENADESSVHPDTE